MRQVILDRKDSVLTLNVKGGLWEVVGTPAEAIASGTKIKAAVTYDEGQKVEAVQLHDDKGNEIPLQKQA